MLVQEVREQVLLNLMYVCRMSSSHSTDNAAILKMLKPVHCMCSS